jgi:dihydrofolate synthase/folylpolyglutamate synthase
VAVVTNVGLDHLVSLGPTLEDIAWHKAGVARPGAPLITGATGAPLEVIRREAAAVGCKLVEVPPGEGAPDHNRRIAREASRLMARRMGVGLDGDLLERGMRGASLAGRTEVMPGAGPTVILDGAHNSEKLAVAVRAALDRELFGPRVAVVGFLGTKASAQLLEPLTGRFDRAVATEPRVYAKPPCPAATTALMLERIGLPAVAAPDPLDALERGMALAGPDGLVLVTGSFYLVGQLRDRWFPKERVVMGQTSWPAIGAPHSPGSTAAK